MSSIFKLFILFYISFIKLTSAISDKSPTKIKTNITLLMITRPNYEIEILIFDLFFNNRAFLGINEGISMFNLDNIFLKGNTSLRVDLIFLLLGCLVIVTLNEKLDPLANSINYEFDINLFAFEAIRVEVFHPELVVNALEELAQNHLLDLRFLAPTPHLLQFLY